MKRFFRPYFRLYSLSGCIITYWWSQSTHFCCSYALVVPLSGLRLSWLSENFRCAMEAGIVTSLITKIISRQTVGTPGIDLGGDFYSRFVFYPPSQANKATVSPRVKILWGSRNKEYSRELSLQLNFKRPREKYRLQRNPTRFLYSKEKVFPFWCLKSS